jgi:putative FmdB family regulatory protein
MPIYDYVCHHCGHRFEVVHGIHDEGPKTCPVCHSSQVRKAFAAPAIHFKGSGWAKKDRSATKRSSGAEGKPAEAGATASTGEVKGAPDSGAGSSGSSGSASSSGSSKASGSGASGSSAGGAATD